MIRPVGYKTKRGHTILIYRFRDLRQFVIAGRETGDVGFIIISKDPSGMVKHKGFGTIEHPSKEIRTIIMKHSPMFDGNWDPNRMIHPVHSNPLTTYRYELIDLSKN
jgi:hypothetical protein